MWKQKGIQATNLRIEKQHFNSLKRENKGVYRFSVWSEGWSEYQFHAALGKEPRPTALLPQLSEEKTCMKSIKH